MSKIKKNDDVERAPAQMLKKPDMSLWLLINFLSLIRFPKKGGTRCLLSSTI